MSRYVDSNTTRARFVNGSDTSELDLWVESCSVTGQNMTVIVEVDQNITTNNYTIYLYYGNMDATAKTDGNATFEFFDDIEDNDVTDYGLTWGSDTLGTSTTSYHGTYAMYLPDGGGSEHDSKWRRNVSPIYLPVIVEYYVRTIAPDTILGVGAPTGEAWDNLPTVGDLGNGRSDGDNPEWNRMGDYPVRFSTTFDRDVWYPIKWLVNTTNVTVIYGSVDTRTDLIPEGGANITAIEIVQVEYGEGNGQFDDIRIRKYHDPEPTYTIGPEEARPPQITITSPENKTYNTNTLYLNVSTDKNASWCGYSLDNQENISMTKLNDTYFWYLNSSMTEGSHNVIFWCNDTSGDVWNSTTRYFSVDTIPPAITIYSPEDKRYDTIYIDLNWSTNESLETLDWTAYSLNGASNVSLYHMEWINTGENFDLVDGVALGITQNGTYLWFSNYDTAEIYRYWMNGSYADFSFNASESSGILEPGGITQDGTYFWITDRQIRSVYRYWMKNGTYADFSFDISEKVGEPYGITNDGAYLWIVDRTSDQVYKYWTNGSYADFDFDTDSYGNDLPIGITQDGTYFWVTDYEDYKVYKYWTNGSYANENIDVYTGVPAIYPGGITQDGTYFWIIFDTGGHVYKYYKNTQLVNETLTALQGYNNLTLCANDTAGNMNCVAVNFSYWIWEITFNIFSGETGENLTNVNVYCNNSWSVAGVDSGYSHNFLQGDYSCTFEKSTYFNKTVTFTADSDKMIDVKMSKIGALTVEEHQWIEWLYDCWFSGDCGQTLDRIETMVVYINQTTTQINETVNKVWNQFKRTDESVVLTEEPISTVVNSTSNITYNYSISVPEKEDYLFLPIRIFYWFLNEDNTSCYSQGNYSVAMIEPYCQPLVAHTIGEVNAVLNFTVELRPSLPAGNYTLVRRIDIDPNDIWINYGHDIIGTIEVLGDTNKAGVSLKAIGITAEVDKRIRTHEESVSEAGTDGITGLSIGEMLNPASLSMVISLVTLMVVIYLVVAKRKQ